MSLASYNKGSMLATFCLRLACGLALALLVLPVAQVNPRFFRVQFLTILALAAGCVFLLFAKAGGLGLAFLFAVMACGFFGSLLFSLEGTPFGKPVIVITALTTVIALLVAVESTRTVGMKWSSAWFAADQITSAMLLGFATTAMLMGHSYLIAPTMSITPLIRLLGGLSIAVGLRMVVAGLGLWTWTNGSVVFSLEEDAWLWLPLRWGLAFIGPLILTWMAWQAAKIRSTQSATGILYVAVIFCFLGELTAQLLRSQTGFVL
ncbi:MAG: hypothetical protein KatS3mg105_0876 [Gemmatales bacterium]|nr:MAG: hypothetical protein KatS3mg105_0876 [Gemmatales bacterium]